MKFQEWFDDENFVLFCFDDEKMLVKDKNLLGRLEIKYPDFDAFVQFPQALVALSSYPR